MDFTDELQTHKLIQPFVESKLQTEHDRLVISKRPRICPSTEKINLASDIFFTEDAFNKYSVSSKWFENLWRKTNKPSTDQPVIPAPETVPKIVPTQTSPPPQNLSNAANLSPVVVPVSQSVESVSISNKPPEKVKKQKKEKKEKKPKKEKKEDAPKVAVVPVMTPASPKPDPKKVAEAVLKNTVPLDASPPKTKFKPPSKRSKSTESVSPSIPITTSASTSTSSTTPSIPAVTIPTPLSVPSTSSTLVPSLAESPVVVPQEPIVPTPKLPPPKVASLPSKPVPPPSPSPSSTPTEAIELGTKRTLRSYVDISPTALKKSKKDTSTPSQAPPAPSTTTTPSLDSTSSITPSIVSTIPSVPSVPASISLQPAPVVASQPAQPVAISPQMPPTQPPAIPQLPQPVPQTQAIQRTPSQPLQRFSMFSESDHKLFLDFQQKFMKEQQRKSMPNAATTPPFMIQLEYQQYSQMLPIVTQEQDEFRSFSHAVAMQNKDIYTIFHPKIQKQVENVLAFRRQRVLTYPKSYDIHHVFDMRTIQPSNSQEAILKHKFTLLQKGKCLLFQKPSSVEIPLNREYFPEASKWCNNNNQSQQSETKEQVAVTRSQPDATQADSTKSHWTKKTMPPLENDPEISHLASVGHKIDIVIGSSALCALMELNRQLEIPVTIKQVSETDNRKLVIIGKPFVNKKMTMREMNTLFFNTALESLGLQMPSGTVRCILFPDKRKNASAEGIAQPGSADSAAQSAEDENQLGENNLTYNLWQFGAMNVLIRCKIHGMVPDKTQQGVRYVGMKTKTEYLPHKGSEEVTIAETALWWTYTYIRPDAHLMLARINVLNNTIVEVEQKNMPSILPPGCLFKPEKSSRIIHTLFDKLCQLPLGNYLISHKLSDHNLVLLKSVDPIPSTNDVTNPPPKTEPDKLYDLHQAHKNTPVTDTETVPYIPLRWAPKPNQIPETFPINKNAKSVFGSIEPQYCQQFLTTGSCTAIGCGLLHARPEQTKNLKLKFCRNFAQYGTCNKLNCQYPHLKNEEVKARMEELGIQKKKKKKKKKKEKQPSSTTDDKHFDLDSKPMDVDFEDVGSDDNFESQLAMHISKQKANEPNNNSNGATEDLAYIMSMLQ